MAMASLSRIPSSSASLSTANNPKPTSSSNPGLLLRRSWLPGSLARPGGPRREQKRWGGSSSSSSSSFVAGRKVAVPPCNAVLEAPVVDGDGKPHPPPLYTTFEKAYDLVRTASIDGKIVVRVLHAKDEEKITLVIACDLPGTWLLHWGVKTPDTASREWDQPPRSMRPLGSVPVKDYAVRTPFLPSSEGNLSHVQIDIQKDEAPASICFVLKDKETGKWYRNRGGNFSVEIEDDLFKKFQGNANIWTGLISGVPKFLKSSLLKEGETLDTSEKNHQEMMVLKEFEYPISKESEIVNELKVSVWKDELPGRRVVALDSDLDGQILLHWGLSSDGSKEWRLPPDNMRPPYTTMYKKSAVQTPLQRKQGGQGSYGVFYIDDQFDGFLFVLKHVDDNFWLDDADEDFYVPLLEGSCIGKPLFSEHQALIKEVQDTSGMVVSSAVFDIKQEKDKKKMEKDETRHLLSEDPASILINNELSMRVDYEGGPLFQKKPLMDVVDDLAAEAYKNFVAFPPAAHVEEDVKLGVKVWRPQGKPCSGTGTGEEILLQGFNWESHRTGKWYKTIGEQAAEIASWGFTVIWVPPPTESVSPEGYMPVDLYNLSSRYGNMEELKEAVKMLHSVGVRVLGDVVLNHRCASYRNHNGVWNLFGGRLNWDDRAIVCDDPHFQGRGNKSNGDNFHAAPNIDHSQEFVRRDIIEWLCWLRSEIGYDGWRLDFVRGFWGGYVKDYLSGTEAHFAVGEYWDSLSYTYGEMNYNQDEHRQRIVDWINATGGNAGAFDVTTKGILHTTLERCEYWRLSDSQKRPPGVVGWWPSRAVTFIENHDTGSTQGHWRFPAGKEIQGYAYILTHPGTPTVFYDHMFSHNREAIRSLMALRRRAGIHCRSVVKIQKAERDVYAAKIDESVIMKIGPGSYHPPSDGKKRWIVATEGPDYKVWEAVL